MKTARTTVADRLRRFWHAESGSQTVEAVIWIPVFVFFLAFMINVTLVFFNESQMLRIVQDANRLFSLGRFTSEDQAENYITEQLAYMSQNVTVATQIAGGLITTQLSIPAIDMMPMQMLAADYFADTQISVVAQHVIEY